jgi:hypothetical protein
MADDLTVRTVLGTSIAKLLAAAIVVLALVPCTAPFSTFDAVEIAAEQTLHANAVQTKTVQDMTDVLCLSIHTSTLMLSTAVHSAALADCTNVLPFRVLVLRI